MQLVAYALAVILLAGCASRGPTKSLSLSAQSRSAEMSLNAETRGTKSANVIVLREASCQDTINAAIILEAAYDRLKIELKNEQYENSIAKRELLDLRQRVAELERETLQQ
jgi:hypothetical protein